MGGCNYSVVRGKNNGTKRNHTDKSCNSPLCREELLQPGWAAGSTFAGLHKFITPVFPEDYHQGTKQKLFPAGISLRKGAQGLQFQVRSLKCAAQSSGAKDGGGL